MMRVYWWYDEAKNSGSEESETLPSTAQLANAMVWDKISAQCYVNECSLKNDYDFVGLLCDDKVIEVEKDINRCIQNKLDGSYEHRDAEPEEE